MKKIKWIVLMGVSIFLFTSLNVNAQKVKLLMGNFSQLKGQTLLNLEYVYDNLIVGKITEEEYITKKVTEYNNKTHGRGDNWLKSWKSDRPSVTSQLI